MISVQKQSLKIYRYANYRHEFDLYSDENLTSPVVINAYTGKLEFRESPGSDVLFTATTENGYLIVSQTQIALDIPTSVVGAWTFDGCLYDLFIISPTGKPTPIVRGTVQVYPAITQIN